MGGDAPKERAVIRTPDQRLRVFVSSTLQELAPERAAARAAVERLHLAPVMFELGARPHPPRDLYRAYLEQSHVFVGVYWQRYGWVAPGETASGLEDEYNLSGDRPKLIYVKRPAPEREERLEGLLQRVQADDQASYRPFSSPEELRELLENDLALLLTERFELSLAEPELPSAVIGPGRAAVPVPPTPMVGRERELAAVEALLSRDEVRLVTLLGPGGIGKSRLALELARVLAPAFPDGVHFVPLAATSDPDSVAPAVARALGLRDGEGRAPLEALAGALRDRSTLLVLDNFEQVLEAAPIVADLLAAAPGLKVLATSRASLRLSGEHEFPVPPLALPNSGGRSPLEAIRDSEAVRLFVERARAVKPDFALDLGNALTVAEICHRLDGLPLAIELAAARTRLLTPQALLERLEHRLGLLTGGARDLPERQRTLRAAIDWSHDLLEEHERRLFAWLGVFVGGFSLEAAEAVCEDRGADVLSTLESLVDKSLVARVEATSEPRFSMLGTIHEYALEKLSARGEFAAARGRHADHFLALAETEAGALLGERGTASAAYARLEREGENLVAAVASPLEEPPAGPQGSGEGPPPGGLEQAATLLWTLWTFWWMSGRLREAKRLTNRLLAQPGVAGWPPRARAPLVSAAGQQAFFLNDLGRATALLTEAMGLWEELGNEKAAALCLLPLGLIASARGQLEQGKSQIERALAAFRQLGVSWGMHLALDSLGVLAVSEGDDASAAAHYGEELASARTSGSALNAAMAMIGLASVLIRRGDLGGGRARLEEALALALELGYRNLVPWALEGFAALALERADAPRAAWLLGAAASLSEASYSTVWSSGLSTFPDLKERVRAALSEAEFAAATAEGRAMGLERALASLREAAG